MKNPNFMPFTSLTQADAPLATRRFGEEAPPAAALPEEAAAAGTRVGDLLASPALEAEAAAGAGAFLAAAGAVLRLAATVACGEPLHPNGRHDASVPNTSLSPRRNATAAPTAA